MTMRKSAPLPAILPKGRRLLENDAARQSDLFSEPSRTQMPAWRDLPEEVRRALTGLMMRLILEHTQADGVVVNREVGHDL
jgi:hypothetical protein